MKGGKLAIDSIEFLEWWTEANEGRLIGEKIGRSERKFREGQMRGLVALMWATLLTNQLFC